MKKKHSKRNTTGKAGAILHGECIISQCPGIPADAVREKHSAKEPYIIIAKSEVTGNHHVIDNKPDLEFFTVGTGEKAKRYLNSPTGATVRCVVADRHTAVEIPPGTHLIGYQQEYDYITESKRNVRD